MSFVALSLLAGLLAVILAIAIGFLRPAWAAWTGAAGAAAASGAVAVAWAAGGGPIIDAPWIPLIGSRFMLTLDPLAAPLAVFMTGIAAPILAFTAAYLPKHLAEHGQSIQEQARFCRLMLLFMLAMILLVLAQDLLIIFVALELTALASFLLIEFDHENAAARSAAMVALVVTAGSSLLFLAGLLLIAARTGTIVIPQLEQAEAIPVLAAFCLALGVIGKSAQFPLHFWLPEAMRAPTPVSAYLHSAALVASGVFVLQRLRPILEPVPQVMTALLYIGFASIIIGGILALISDKLKTVLAYSTIAQYGYAVVMIAIGTTEGFIGAAFFILAHGLCKAALFLTSGAVTITTHADKLSQTGGYARHMPLLAISSAVAAIGLAGLPATVGYFKDEFLFAAALHHGPATAALAVAAVAMTLAYTGRFWWGLFMGDAAAAEKAPHTPSLVLTLPVTLLAGLALIGGLWYKPLEQAFVPAGEVIGGESLSLHFAYHFDGRPEMWMAFAAWVGGLLLLLLRRAWEKPLSKAAEATAPYLGPAIWSDRLAYATHLSSDWLYRIELRDLRDRVRIVLVPAAALIFAGVLAHGTLPEADSVTVEDLPVIAGLLVAAGAAFATNRTRRHVTTLLVMSFVGFGLALTFALSGAPDVALVIAIIETALTTLFFAVIWQMPSHVFLSVQENDRQLGRTLFSVAGAVAAFFLAWIALEIPRTDSIAWAQVALTESAHGKDVVTVILADFRGLDTAGELTVLAVGVLGAAAIKWGREE